MNKNVFWIIIAILVIVIGGYLLYSQSNQPVPAKESGEKAGTEDINIGIGELQEGDNMMEEESMMEDDSMMDDEDSMMEDDKTMDDSMSDDDNITEDDDMMEDDKMMDGSTSRTGTYEAYDASKLAMASDGDVVLFFHAGWCPTCKVADRNINANLSDIPDNTHILKTDYDTAAELKKKYGVTYQHTFVQVDAQGNLIKKWSGSNTLSALLSQIQ